MAESSTVGSAPSAPDDPPRITKILDFMRVVGKLKEVKRTGWVRSGVRGAESVADHMYRMAMMGFALGAADGVDSTKCIKMALVHDLAESLIGDLVTEGESHRQDKITREEKIRLEREALHGICDRLGGDAGEEIRSLWEEFETGDGVEARHLRDLDKFEMVLQASDYEEAQSMALPDFFRSTAGKFTTAVFKALDAEVRQRRERRQRDESEAQATKRPRTD
mmetsp:Transcript_22465/g.64578  ORF Transcript_22465/g.64578 Transcript_22465/m.64578 type:complete len:222 (-) Transcript_22465:27-692(-)